MSNYLFLFFCFVFTTSHAQITRFEKSNGAETATYQEIIQFYEQLDKRSDIVTLKTFGSTDAGYPLHLVLISGDKSFNPEKWHKENKVLIFINNGIHPGEPDGIDASMLLARDIGDRKVILPTNVTLAIIPVYNIGGCLNRNAYSRVNQNGPLEYGFRGNSQNLDLNRDFTKMDSREARTFAEIYHFLEPDIFIDNHVSDGADYQHTITLLTTQYDKLVGDLGTYLKNNFEPAIYSGMKQKGWDMIPYLNVESLDFEKGISMFLETPRYSSGYTSLFNTLAFTTETHMLKPFKERVKSTYDLLQTMIMTASKQAIQLKAERKKAMEMALKHQLFPIGWVLDSTHFTTFPFKGYEKSLAKSEATGLQKRYFDHSKPVSIDLKFYNHYIPKSTVSKPLAYIIPYGWYAVTDLMKFSGIKISQLKKDTIVTVTQYHIDQYKSLSQPFEKHHKNYAVSVTPTEKKVKFSKGDFIIYLNQPANRFIIEMLEPTSDDSYFAWNYFDAILQQKEYYSDYRWEDIAAETLKKDPELQLLLAKKKESDTSFATDSKAILDFIYRHSPYYEPAHLNYPVYRVEMNKE